MRVAAVILLLALWFSSCVTYERCVDRYGVYPSDTLGVPVTVEVPVLVRVPPDSATLQAALDSLLAGKVITAGPDGDSAGLSVAVWYDRATNTVNAEAKRPSIAVHDTVTHLDTLTIAAPPMLVKPPTLRERAAGLYARVAAYGFPVCLLIILLDVAIWKYRK